MRAVLQRVSWAKVKVDNALYSNIHTGILLLLAITVTDKQSDVDYLIKKISLLRIFADDKMKMNHSILDIEAEILIVSQFTLYADTQKGNRPSFLKSAPHQQALDLYQYFVQKAQEVLGSNKVKTGKFGHYMQIELLNDGPVTILMDSKNISL